MEPLILAATAVGALLIGGGVGFAWSQRDARDKHLQLRKRIAQLEQTRKAGGERIAQMRDQIMGLNKIVAELRQIQARLEADKRRRETLEKTLEQSPFDTGAKSSAKGDARSPKGPASTFADTEVLE
jgi:TolA-binding protein